MNAIQSATFQARNSRELLNIYINSLAWFNAQIAQYEKNVQGYRADVMRKARGETFRKINRAHAVWQRDLKTLRSVVAQVEGAI